MRVRACYYRNVSAIRPRAWTIIHCLPPQHVNLKCFVISSVGMDVGFVCCFVVTCRKSQPVGKLLPGTAESLSVVNLAFCSWTEGRDGRIGYKGAADARTDWQLIPDVVTWFLWLTRPTGNRSFISRRPSRRLFARTSRALLYRMLASLWIGLLHTYGDALLVQTELFLSNWNIELHNCVMSTGQQTDRALEQRLMPLFWFGRAVFCIHAL